MRRNRIEHLILSRRKEALSVTSNFLSIVEEEEGKSRIRIDLVIPYPGNP